MSQRSQLEGILAFTQALIQGIPGIGLVHTYQPILLDGAQITADLGVSGAVHYWTISPVASTETWLTSEELEVRHEVAIRGYMEVVDAATTDPLFRQLTTAVADIFRSHFHIGGVTHAELFGPVQTPQRAQHQVLAQTFLVHYCECRLFAQELLRINL